MANFQAMPLIRTYPETYRLGTKADPLTQADVGKAVTVGPDGSQRILAADGDWIAGFVTSVEAGLYNGYVIGGVAEHDFHLADTDTLDPGTLVVVASNPASGTEGLTKVRALAAGEEPTPAETSPTIWMVERPGLIKRL